METYPRGADLRRLLLERCASYCALAGVGRTVLSEKLVNSPKYLGGLAAGRTKLTDVAYDRCMMRLDDLFAEIEKPDETPDTPKDNPDDEQRSGGEGGPVPATDRRDRRRAGHRKGRAHGGVPDAAE